MAKYTTGEIAKLCNVSVRTVQYYDTREILMPGELSEGGRRIYSEKDLKKMKLICYLRELGLPIESIKDLLQSENADKVLSLLLDRQEEILNKEISEGQDKLKRIETLRQALQTTSDFSLESIGAITHKVENKKKLKRIRIMMLLLGLPVTALQWVAILLWVLKGIWWVMPIWAVTGVVYGVWVSQYYFKSVAYICPECHTIFLPRFKEAFFANHTPTTRKLTCTACQYHGYCVETYKEEKKNGA